MANFPLKPQVLHIIRKPDYGHSRIESARLKAKNGKPVKIIEELIPIACYVQARYSRGRKIKIRWLDGTQHHDAIILSSGPLVDEGYVLKKQHIEVTTAVHENEHFLRKYIDEHGGGFSSKGIKVKKKPKEIKSKPYVYSGNKAEKDLANKILERITDKNSIEYPENTVLLIQCILDLPFFANEWNESMEEVKNKLLSHRFREIFIFDSNHNYSSTLYGSLQNPLNKYLHRTASPLQVSCEVVLVKSSLINHRRGSR